jgi:hypothetical protein
VRFEPFSEDARGAKLLALRVLQIVEPIKYATSTGNGGDITEGSLLHHPKTENVLTDNTGRERYRDLGLLLAKFLRRQQLPSSV